MPAIAILTDAQRRKLRDVHDKFIARLREKACGNSTLALRPPERRADATILVRSKAAREEFERSFPIDI